MRTGAVWEQTLEDQRLGFLSDFVDEDFLNNKFGAGGMGRHAALPDLAARQVAYD